jgi:hypothetical protein
MSETHVENRKMSYYFTICHVASEFFLSAFLSHVPCMQFACSPCRVFHEFRPPPHFEETINIHCLERILHNKSTWYIYIFIYIYIYTYIYIHWISTLLFHSISPLVPLSEFRTMQNSPMFFCCLHGSWPQVLIFTQFVVARKGCEFGKTKVYLLYGIARSD